MIKRFYNPNYGVLLYPTSWFSAFRCLLAGAILGGFKRTWKKNPYWYKPNVAGCIECQLKETNYPDECGG